MQKLAGNKNGRGEGGGCCCCTSIQAEAQSLIGIVLVSCVCMCVCVWERKVRTRQDRGAFIKRKQSPTRGGRGGGGGSRDRRPRLANLGGREFFDPLITPAKELFTFWYCPTKLAKHSYCPADFIHTLDPSPPGPPLPKRDRVRRSLADGSMAGSDASVNCCSLL